MHSTVAASVSAGKGSQSSDRGVAESCNRSRLGRLRPGTVSIGRPSLVRSVACPLPCPWSAVNVLSPA
jgi:hypothetical protein